MTDDWLLPGGATIADGEGKLRIVPPENWERIILEVHRVPPSMNTDQSRGWRAFYEHKRAWQTEIETLLMVQRTGRYQRAMAGCIMRFGRRAARRDAGNFSGIVNKALGDALTTRLVIPDDDAEHYFFGGVEFAIETGAPRTWIHLFLQPKES